MEVFHQFRENLKGLKSEVGSSGGGGHCETSEYASEVSEDYNSVDGSTSEARLEICEYVNKDSNQLVTAPLKPAILREIMVVSRQICH